MNPDIEPFEIPLPFNLLCTSKRGIHAIQCSSTKDRNQLNLNDFFERPLPFLDRFQRLNMVCIMPNVRDRCQQILAASAHTSIIAG